MAGGGSLGGGGKPKRGKAGKRKQKKRVGFVLDMTPLVDITFLLLTFFMFTTTMTTPQVMEMKVPPESDTPVEVAESKLLSIIIDDEGDLFYFRAREEAKELKMSELRKLAVEENLRSEVRNQLITVLKISDDVDYGKVVKVLDELNLAEASILDQLTEKRERKFTIAELTEEDYEKIAMFNDYDEESSEGEENDN